eukprot:734033-Prorocentrum_lima.AAC.1
MGSAGRGAAGVGFVAMQSSSASRTPAHETCCLLPDLMPTYTTPRLPIPSARACPTTIVPPK